MGYFLSKYSTRYDRKADDQRGIALLIAVFVITFATLLIYELGRLVSVDQQVARGFSEEMKARFVLKSSLNLSRILLVLPKEPEFMNTTSLQEPWALIAAAPYLPIEGFQGNVRISIIDEEGKIDINQITSQANIFNPSGVNKPQTFWVNALQEVFRGAGFTSESYDAEEFRTLGNTAYDPENQTAIVYDWLDADTASYTGAEIVGGRGIESGAPKDFFFNRPLLSLSELLNIPGITQERLMRIATQLRVSPNRGNVRKAVNVNTASRETLLALGITDYTVSEIIDERQENLPYQLNVLRALLDVEGIPELKNNTKVSSNEFSVYARAELPNSVHWMRAVLARTGSDTTPNTLVQTVEFY